MDLSRSGPIFEYKVSTKKLFFNMLSIPYLCTVPMAKLRHLFLIALIFQVISGLQIVSAQANTCGDAVNIFYNGDYSVEFTGKDGADLGSTYPSLKDKITSNQIWCTYLPSEDGELNFEASLQNGPLKMVIFKEEVDDVCGEIGTGLAEIQRIQLKEFSNIGLAKETGNGKLFSLKLYEGKKIQIVFFGPEKSTERMKLNWNFVSSTAGPEETKIVDFRKDEFTPSLHIKLVDKSTKRSLIGRLSIDGNKAIAAQYIGSDFYFSVDRKCKLSLNSEVEGYFFNDIVVAFEGTQNEDIVIELDRAVSGKSIQLEEIQFQRGTSEILPSSEPKLKRLKDFLLLNSDLNVEIQGHVHAKGDNNRENDRLSEARAKRVMKYLVDNGIDKDRLTTVGYGNTKPVYPEAKFSYEEQANRRVEILVK